KLSQLLTHGEKSYRGKMRLGIETTTYDREGEVTRETSGPWPTPDALELALAAFRGEIEQVPPPYSAVKQRGARAAAPEPTCARWPTISDARWASVRISGSCAGRAADRSRPRNRFRSRISMRS